MRRSKLRPEIEDALEIVFLGYSCCSALRWDALEVLSAYFRPERDDGQYWWGDPIHRGYGYWSISFINVGAQHERAFALLFLNEILNDLETK